MKNQLQKETFLSLGVGNTPLVFANNLSNKFQAEIYLKLESTLPYSHTFKDRGAVSAINQAKKEGYRSIIFASCGNMSVAMVQLASKANIETRVILSSECNLPNKVTMAIAGGNIIEYAGRFDEVDDIISQYSQENPQIPCINTNYQRYYELGLRTLYYELFETLSPKYNEVNIIVPTADGTLVTALYKAYLETKENYPKIKFLPHFVIAQPNLCSPLVEAFEQNKSIEKWSKGQTDVLSLSVDYPHLNGDNALEAIKNTQGCAIAVDETETPAHVKTLGINEGIFTDDVGGICIGSLYKLQDKNFLTRPTVCLMTGNGLKTYQKYVGNYANLKAKNSEELFNFLDAKI